MAGPKDVLVKRVSALEGWQARRSAFCASLGVLPSQLKEIEGPASLWFYQTGRAREDAGGGADLPINNATCTAGRSLILVPAIAYSATV
jgi:hypothetical protein